MGRVFADGPEDQVSVPAQIIPKKVVLMTPGLSLSIIRYASRVKWSNPGNGAAPSSTPQCGSC